MRQLRFNSFIVVLIHLTSIVRPRERFPLNEFLGSDNPILHTLYRDTSLCEVAGGTHECCKCDSACVKYKDCCADAQWIPGENMTSYKKKIQMKTYDAKHLECVDAFPMSLKEIYGGKSYYMVSTCHMLL